MTDAMAANPSTETPDELSGLLSQLRQAMGQGGGVEEFQKLLSQLSAAQAVLDAVPTGHGTSGAGPVQV